ncbi:TPA: hypothetical protein I7682_18015 [Vibrio vulnificus]|nr:hypothetical protein [Vibrio vulnificus]
MNSGLKLMLMALLGVVLLLGVRSCGGGDRDIVVGEPETKDAGDGLGTTESEELRTVAARMDGLMDKYTESQTQIQNLKTQIQNLQELGGGLSGEKESQTLTDLQVKVKELNDQLKTNNENKSGAEVDAVTVQGMVSAEVEKVLSHTQALLNPSKSVKPTHNPLTGESVDYEVSGEYDEQSGEDETIIWTAPIDAPDIVDKGEIDLTKLKERMESFAKSASEKAQDTLNQVKTVPVFTLPANSTLMGAKLTNRMIGLVPKNGEVQGAMGFKVIVPGRSFVANGHTMNGLSHAFMAGYSVGNFSLKCANAFVTNMTFVFNDGRIKQIGAPYTGAKSSDSYIAVLTDPSGTECISGQLKTDWKEYAGTSMLFSAATGAAEALVEAQMTTKEGSDNSSSKSLTGDAGKVVAGNTVSSGLKDGQAWVAERWSQTFDAILVDIGRTVHIETKSAIEVDYDPTDRLIHYRTQDEAIAIANGEEVTWEE